MPRILKSLLTRKRKEPSLEELEAYNFARMALLVRVEHLLRHVTKAVFPFTGEEFPDRTAQTLFNHMIGIHKRQAQTASQLPADGGFARAR